MSKSNKPLVYLSVEQVLLLHEIALKYGGGAKGVRDEKVLESAVMAVQATFEGKLLHETIEEVASAYLYYLCQNHPFADGNKRTAILAALSYLDWHEVTLKASVSELEHLVLSVSQGVFLKKDIVKFFRQKI